MKKHLVLAGAGHAHMVTMENIHVLRELGHTVTVIGPSEYHYYSGMGPGMLGSGYDPEDIRFEVKRKVKEQGGVFIRDSIVGLDPNSQELYLQSGKTVTYDVVSFNTGSHVNVPEIKGNRENIYTVKPIERLYQARTEISALAQQKAVIVAVVGGGPAGVEVAGNVSQLLASAPYPADVILFAGSSFLGRFPRGIQEKSRTILKRSGVSIREEGHLTSITDNRLSFSSGVDVDADFILLATGVHPASFFKKSGLQTGADGGLSVNRFLQCPDYPEIFGGGDCINFRSQPLDKVGVYAVRENPVLFHNIKAYLEEEKLQAFDPGGDYLLIFNLGNHQGVLRKKWFQISGRLAFRIKDWIDRKFMADFQ